MIIRCKEVYFSTLVDLYLIDSILEVDLGLRNSTFNARYSLLFNQPDFSRLYRTIHSNEELIVLDGRLENVDVALELIDHKEAFKNVKNKLLTNKDFSEDQLNEKRIEEFLRDL